jgi:hypothetical protein
MTHLKCDSMFNCLGMEKALETEEIKFDVRGEIWLVPNTGPSLQMKWCPFCGNDLKLKETQDAEV